MLDFPHGPMVKNPPANAEDTRDMGSIPESEWSPGGGNSNPLQYSCQENSIDRRAWWAIVHCIKKNSWTQPNNWARTRTDVRRKKNSQSSVQFSSSVVSNSLRPHGLQHTRLPYPSPAPRACSNSCPLSWWSHPTILPSVVPFSSCLQSFPASASAKAQQKIKPHFSKVKYCGLKGMRPFHKSPTLPIDPKTQAYSHHRQPSFILTHWEIILSFSQNHHHLYCKLSLENEKQQDMEIAQSSRGQCCLQR